MTPDWSSMGEDEIEAWMRATSHPVRGHSMPIVWVCTPAEYDKLTAAGGLLDGDGIPWPLDAVGPVVDVHLPGDEPLVPEPH